MTISQALTLINPAVPFLHSPDTHPLTWADLGCGSGLFTEALAHLLPADSTIYGIDTRPTLRAQTTPNKVHSIPQQIDFVTTPLDLPTLNGILMANSLHYVKDKPALIKKLRTHMHPHSPFLIVEYDTDTPVSTWVPFPISYNSLTKLFTNTAQIKRLGDRPSSFGRSNMYAAIALPA